MSEVNDYDKAISAYQFQVERYHTWMNYYSLFHGALLVALYSLINEKECYCNNNYLSLIICLLGYIASLCWLGTVIGNAKWIKRWLDVIKEYEKENDKFSIYIKSGKDIEKENTFLSTQKIMIFFVSFVCLSWIVSASILNLYSLIFILAIFALVIYIYECTSWIHS